MERKKQERNHCLLVWLGSLPLFTEDTSSTSDKVSPLITKPTNEDFRDGRMTARILKQLIDPVYFSSLNHSQKESTELVKVVERMKKYLAQQSGHPVPSSLVPNAGKIITSGDLQEINRLLQFILNCAVNSQRKDSFVTNIMQMEETVQFDLMEAIKEMLKASESDKDLNVDIPDVELSIHGQVAALNEIIERVSQEKHDLKVKLSEIMEEKVALLTENERLNNQLTAHLNDPESIHVSLKHQEEYKKEAERLREENYRLEAHLDDYKLRIQVLEKQLGDTESKLTVSQSYHDEVLRTKDEIDSLREAASKIPQLENSILSYKKKLESLEFLRRNCKDLEEQNEKLHKSNISLEDEVKKAGTWKTQVDDIKKKLIETQHSLSQETQKARRLDFELERMREKLGSVQSVADRLQEEKSTLITQVEELRLNGNGGGGLAELHLDSVNSMDLVPTSAKQRITRLELENEELKKKVNASILLTSDEGSRVIVEELRKREAELDEELLKKNQDMVDLKSSCEEKIGRLEAIIQAKDEELKKKENQYKKCMDKAKIVITTLEPTGVAHSSNSSTKSQETSGDSERARAVREIEEKLLASAFYNYGLIMHRHASESRATTLLQKSRNNLHTSSNSSSATTSSSSNLPQRRRSEF